LLKHAPRPQATARLFCFSPAGVGASAYRLWPEALPASLEVCPIQLPGRESRLRESPCSSIAALVDALAPALLPQLNLPYALFGHSMGAVLASELTRKLATMGQPLPQHLIVSGRRPPHLIGAEAPLRQLPDAEFVAEINRRYRGIPAAVMQQPELLSLLLPCLRADITALETHWPSGRAPLACPISAFGGSDDALTPREHLEAWAEETTAEFQVRMFPGDHFYLNPQRAQVLREISATLAPLLSSQTYWSARA
jgi:medium-chain acyl-[acyl-carrier-protein] hydrolase